MANGSQIRTEVITEVVFLSTLVDRVVAGKIRVPKFQRAFVWKQVDVHALLDSVLRGFPIGSILVWDAVEAIDTTNRIGPVPIGEAPDGVVGYLLDGQQRVSTLVGTLRLPNDEDGTAANVDWRVYCDLDTREIVRASAGRMEPQYFPVSSLLDTASFIAACRAISSKAGGGRRAQRWIEEADRLATAFRDYQVPVVHIREADLDSAVTVFARLNRSGRKMTADEMVSALTYKEGEFHLAQELNDFKGELHQRGFGGVDRVLLLRGVLAALGRDIYAKDWADLMVKREVREKLPEGFELATSGIRGALDFLNGLGVTSDRLLPYGLQLVLLGEFFRLCSEPGEELSELLARWFWVTSFTGWFGGVNTSQVRLALREISHLARGEKTDVEVIRLDAPALPFPSRFDGRSARVRAFLLYLASLQPCSLRSLDPLDPGKLLSAWGPRAMGYVLASPTDLPEHFSSPANRMFRDHGLVGQTFQHLISLDDERLSSVLPGHGFPAESLQRLRDGDRSGLIVGRLDALVAGEREFMRSRKVTEPTKSTAVPIADSDTSDDSD